jgi:hypothetical protein
MVRSQVIITMEGDLPHEAFSKKYKPLIEGRIQNSITDKLGEYEIHGEFFGDDDEVYALFLNGVKLEEKTDGQDPSKSIIKTLESRIKSLESELKKTETKLDSYRSKPEKYSLGELNIRYTALPFCEHCGENHEEFGVEIKDPTGGTSWCLNCFTSQYDLCKQDVTKIEKERKKKEKAYYKKKAK